jgi:hypothetical protein
MGHTYSNLAGFKRYLADNATDIGTTADADMVATLESVSRSIDEFCRRTGPAHPMSGFGPRLGTNRYDGNGRTCLELDDDLLATTGSIVVRFVTAATTGVSPVVETDFYYEPYDRTPYRAVELHGYGSLTFFPGGKRTIDWPGKWGYQDVRVTSSATVAEVLDTTETGVDVSDGTVFSPGHTFLVDAEQMYVRSIATNTLTVVRGVNGTTAATHASGASIDVYQYPADIVDACNVVAQRRRKQRDAGATMSLAIDAGGAGGMPIVANRDTERALLVNLIQSYRFTSI